MWGGTYSDLRMTEGDFGLALPFTITGFTLGANDSLKFTFKQRKNGAVLLEKTYDSITENTVNLEFTEEESALFKPGSFAYSLDWYQDGSFLCNIIESGILKVGDKA